VATQRSPKNGSLIWEEDASPDNRFRRVQHVSPPTGRVLPGMPLEMPDPDDEDSPRRRRRIEKPPTPWWRPSSKLGRIFLGLCVALMVGAVVMSYLLVAHFLERDSRFRIAGSSNIQATGLIQVSRADMLPVFGEDIGKNIFFIHLGERRKQLEQIPWVQSATVMRLLPDQIHINIVERTPIAFVRQGQQIALVDADGVLLSMPPSKMTQHHYSFPVVTGIDPRDPPPSRRARMAVYQSLVSQLDSSGQHLSEQISEIDLTNPEDARVLMPETGADILAHFGDDQFLARYQRYKAHIAEWRQQYPRLAAVDLRYDEQVVLEMAPGSGPSVTAGEGQAPANPTPSKPSAATLSSAATKPAAKAPANPERKTKPHSSAKPAAKSALEKKREEARRAAQARRQKLNNAASSRQGQ
jgi:cell division protein FtsQ